MSQPEVNVPMFIPTLPSIPAAFSDLMANYSGIPPDKQHDHVLQLRDQAYKHYPYPCLGRWRFLDLDLSVHPLYKTVLEILSSDLRKSNLRPTTFLDLGCCLGQDLRKLISDLVNMTSDVKPPHVEIVQKIFGADLRPEFIQVGYELFGDENMFPTKHLIAPADVFDTSASAPLAVLDGKINVLNCTAVFHLFGWDEQEKVADRCLSLLNRDGIEGKGQKKALLLGSQTANVTAGGYPRRSGGMRYRHNDESWSRLWHEVAGSEKWRDIVKDVEVGSELQERSMDSKARDGLGEKVNVGKAGSVVGSVDAEERPKMIGKLEDGFRWQVWWVWVEFH